MATQPFIGNSWPANTTPVAPDGNGNMPQTIVGVSYANTANANRYLRIFDRATKPTMGTDQATWVIPLRSSYTETITFPKPMRIQLGFWVSLTTLIADLDNTPPLINEVLLQLWW